MLLSALPLAMQGQAVLTSPAPGSTLSGSTVNFTLQTAGDVSQYQLWLGTAGVGSGNLGVYSFGSTSISSLTAPVTGIPTSGGTVYARLFTDISGNWQATDYTYKEASQNTPDTAALSAVSCSSASVTGSGTDACTVALSAAAPSGGTTVTLSSSTSAVKVPASVTVAEGATSGAFTATVSAVSTAQSGTVSASAGGATETFALQLKAASSTSGYAVNLSWDAPSDSSISGYNIYRSPSSGGTFSLLNSTVNTPTSYTDSTVAGGSSYQYEVTTVDDSGVESAPSNVFTATIP